MTTGEKIRRIRTFRKMTQKELADRVGLTANGANRIAQYEMGYRVPKKALLEKMAEAMDAEVYALSESGNGDAIDIMEMLFWMEEGPFGAIRLTQMQRADTPYNAAQDREIYYADNDDWPPRAPVALWFDAVIIDDFLREWAVRQQELSQGKITRDEYFEWKIKWPASADDCGSHTPKRAWRKEQK